ncbi:MAG: hypothetical protein RL563_332 [Pseudomonadota bacterium]
MRLNAEITQLLSKFDINQSDIELIREAGKILIDEMPQIINDFYEWLSRQDEFNFFFSDDVKALERVKKLQIEHWNDFFKAELDEVHLMNRRRIGAMHAHIDLPNDIFCAGLSVMHDLIINRLLAKTGVSQNTLEMLSAIKKMTFLDTYLVLDEINQIQKQKLLDHSESLQELSTPVIPIWEGVLLLPLLGIIDSSRTQDIMKKTLSKIAETRSKVFIMDISGVAAVDTAVANQLIKITKATQLMGCDSIISGISPAISQTLVELGISVGEIFTTATLRDALELGLRKLGQANIENTSHSISSLS